MVKTTHSQALGQWEWVDAFKDFIDMMDMDFHIAHVMQKRHNSKCPFMQLEDIYVIFFIEFSNLSKP